MLKAGPASIQKSQAAAGVKIWRQVKVQGCAYGTHKGRHVVVKRLQVYGGKGGGISARWRGGGERQRKSPGKVLRAGTVVNRNGSAAAERRLRRQWVVVAVMRVWQRGAYNATATPGARQQSRRLRRAVRHKRGWRHRNPAWQRALGTSARGNVGKGGEGTGQWAGYTGIRQQQTKAAMA